MSEVKQPGGAASLLLVEDDADLRTIGKEYFEKAGYKVVTAVDGVEALHRSNLQRFHAIVCDLAMPRMSGDKMIDFIRKSSFNADTPIVVLNGHIDKKTIAALHGKVQKAFTKPASFDEVAKYLSQVGHAK